MAKSSLTIFKRGKSGKIVFGVVFVLFALYALTLLYPLLWMLINSLKDSAEYSIDISLRKPFAFPKALVFKNYAEAITLIKANDTSYVGMIWNSIWISAVNIAGVMIFPAVCGYCLSRYKFVGRRLLYVVSLASMMIPIVGAGGAYMALIRDLKLFNTPVLKIASATGGFGTMTFMILYSFYKNLPWSYAEAVFIDGGGHYTVFFKIMWPQSMPILSVFAITTFIGTWNEYLSIIMYMPSYPTLSSGMYTASYELMRMGRYPIYFAGMIISMIPVIALFIAFSGKMLTSLSVGGIKG